MMNVQSIILLTLVMAVFAAIIIRRFSSRRKEQDCNTSSDNCESCTAQGCALRDILKTRDHHETEQDLH